MNVTRVKEDITAISYDILRRNGISVKFKVKTYYEGLNKSQNYYYTNYIYNIKSEKKSSININPKAYIQFDFGIDDGKSVFFLSEVYKNRFVRKLLPLVKILDDYDNGDIDIVKVDQSGTHIDSRIPTINMKLGVHKVSATVIIREEKIDVGVLLSIDNMSIELSIYDFIDLIIKINNINYMQLSISLLNHIGAPELGSNEIDFRPQKIESIENRDSDMDSIAPNKSTISNLNSKKSYSSRTW